MSKYLRNRSTKEIVAFLIAHGFRLSNTHGDDDIFIKSGWKYPVKVTRNQKSTPIGTMQSITKWSGYKNKEWIKWWKENRFGE